MPTVPAYLGRNRNKIQALREQGAFRWSDAFERIDHKKMRKLKSLFPDREIRRNDLRRLFSEWNDPELAFLATMVWGGIDTSKRQRFQGLLGMPSALLNKKLESLKDLVNRGLHQVAFLSCCKAGANYLPNVGPSYFTKVLFFLGESSKSSGPKPLILDKWTVNAFCALGCESLGSETMRNFFTKPSRRSFRRYNFISLRPADHVRSSAYTLYNSLMEDWARNLDVSASRLEQFVFGNDLRKDKSPTNPRLVFLCMIEEAGMLKSA